MRRQTFLTGEKVKGLQLEYDRLAGDPRAAFAARMQQLRRMAKDAVDPAPHPIFA